MLLRVNYFAADKGKSLTCRVFFKYKDDPFMRVCGIPHDLLSTDFLPNSLIQFFFIEVF